jgi:hypothetical protein
LKQRVRIGMTAAAAVLFGIELLIGLFAHGWVRDSLGDVLVVMLLYALWRAVLPEKPAYGLYLPVGILLFAFAVELLQLWGFCDKLHITNRLLRILIGTGFSVKDLLCYAAGAVPCAVCELFLYYITRRRK